MLDSIICTAFTPLMTNLHPYAGDLTPSEAWEMLQLNKTAQLVDVRTEAEWAFVGMPDMSLMYKQPIALAWRLYPDMQVNPRFAEALSHQLPDINTPLLFLCRSGGRSREAAIAMTQLGYKHCYNIIEGFEGNLSSSSQRGSVTGWKAAKLPWRQS